MGLLVIFGVALLVAGWFAGEPLLVEWRRARIRRRPFPDAWREILRRRVPYFRLLPADLQIQLKRHIQVFLAEKPFIGCAGLEVTDEMRVTIAAQACLLLLNRRPITSRTCGRSRLPGRVHRRSRAHGCRRRAAGAAAVLSGESWSQGQVILSWDDVVEGASVVDDGRNVVIHEFAHQLDQQNGHANGAPLLIGRKRYERWARVLGEEFASCRRGERGSRRYSVITVRRIRRSSSRWRARCSSSRRGGCWEHAELYRELSRFYRVNPLSW